MFHSNTNIIIYHYSQNQSEVFLGAVFTSQIYEHREQSEGKRQQSESVVEATDESLS